MFELIGLTLFLLPGTLSVQKIDRGWTLTLQPLWLQLGEKVWDRCKTVGNSQPTLTDKQSV